MQLWNFYEFYKWFSLVKVSLLQNEWVTIDRTLNLCKFFVRVSCPENCSHLQIVKIVLYASEVIWKILLPLSNDIFCLFHFNEKRILLSAIVELILVLISFASNLLLQVNIIHFVSCSFQILSTLMPLSFSIILCHIYVWIEININAVYM